MLYNNNILIATKTGCEWGNVFSGTSSARLSWIIGPLNGCCCCFCMIYGHHSTDFMTGPFLLSISVFPVCRNARIASIVWQFRLFVCPSVTLRYCVKTMPCSMVHFALSDSKMSSFVETKKYSQGHVTPSPWNLGCNWPTLLIAASLGRFCLVAPQR